MALAENLVAAANAVAYVKGLGILACNKVSDRLAAAGGIDSVIGTDQGMNSGDLGVAGAGVGVTRGVAFGNLRSKVAHCINVGFGNCQEQAEIALLHIFDAGIHPVDLVYFSNPDYDHAWVVIGLDPGAQSGNLRSWGPHAVWCDPWQGDGIAVSIDDIVKGKVRNMSAIYKCDSLERIEAGLPASMMHIA